MTGGMMNWHSILSQNTDQKLSSGGYHHHIANNIWQSNGAGKRDLDRSGLSFVQINDTRNVKTRVIDDPWGNEIRINKI
jgi:catechol 2,3-dioxygenase